MTDLYQDCFLIRHLTFQGLCRRGHTCFAFDRNQQRQRWKHAFQVCIRAAAGDFERGSQGAIYIAKTNLPQVQLPPVNLSIACADCSCVALLFSCLEKRAKIPPLAQQMIAAETSPTADSVSLGMFFCLHDSSWATDDGECGIPRRKSSSRA